MSRFAHVCDVCGQLGPYGFYHDRPDGTHGRLWACEAHRVEVRARAGVSVPTKSQPPPASVPVQVPVPRRPGELF